MKLSQNASASATAMINHYQLSSVTAREKVEVRQGASDGHFSLVKRNKYTIHFCPTPNGYTFSYDGQPKAVAQTLFNRIYFGEYELA